MSDSIQIDGIDCSVSYTSQFLTIIFTARQIRNAKNKRKTADEFCRKILLLKWADIRLYPEKSWPGGKIKRYMIEISIHTTVKNREEVKTLLKKSGFKVLP